MERLQRLQFLTDEILKHNKNYYQNDNPTISDAEYDKLYYELVDLEKELNFVLPNSPTKQVGSDVQQGFKKRTHKHKLYSLNKVRSQAEMEKWADDMFELSPKTLFSLEYKFDGLQLVIEFENGKFLSATTRGNGEVGEDVTKQVATIKSLPKTIDFKGHLIVQGEGMMTNSNFEKYNKTAQEPLKNPRNAAAGAIRNLDPNETAKRELDFFCYSIISCDDKIFETQKDMNKFLRENGFKTGGYFKLFDNVEDLQKEILQVDRIKDKLDFQIDGMVIKVNDVENRDMIGFTNKFPKWALAYKFEAEELTTILQDVVWQVGRTGKVTPLAIVEPVELAGATVQRATLNNIDDINRKKLSINSRVFIRRSNEVIPEILGLAESFENSVKIEEPLCCPCCSSLLIKKGPLLYCQNHFGCKDQIVARLCHFVSRDALNIEGLNEKTVEDFYQVLNVKKFSQIFEITKDMLMNVEKIKDKKAENIFNSIQNSKNISFSKFLYALGIFEVGVKTARDLSKNFATFNDLKNASVEDLVNIKDIGEVIATNIFDYFNNQDNFCEIGELFDKGVNIIYENKNIIESYFTGKKVVITGTLQSVGRKELTDLLFNLGAEVQSQISSKTDVLIVGENAGSKLKKAKDLNIEIVDQQKLQSLI